MACATGTVIERRADMALVETQPAAACAGCEQAHGCPESAAAGRAWRVEAVNACGAVPGDEVALALAPGGLTTLAALAYLVPALFAVIGAALGSGLAPVDPDVGAGLGLLAGLALAVGLLVLLHPRLAKARRLRLTIVEIHARSRGEEGTTC